ncbi:ATP-binding protein [Antarcticibacterium flavum]|uniref:ATP-binding protein n=1 Tax=Antarcticibacterium flavum TaxID=2058175 RepID=A0A5B7X908_9FLAO|nr:ATP-binding protein [Antarcticibacterium flavum]MCM4160349.1 ATPase [Antarcticibacterium sp. W02-3]QCY71272.1 ATP-binding protein [Antarcticibacterium flavum]
MQNKKIVITGGPGTGKSSVIKHLEREGYICYHEVSREITAAAQKQGISQLFLEKPILFSEKLLEARVKQHIEASLNEVSTVFLDRGIPDVVAYMEYFGTTYPQKFQQACEDHSYYRVFLLPPWEDIYQTDNERYESFEQALLIHDHLKKTYLSYGYEPIEVPKNTIENRSDFILNNIPM